MKIRTQWRKLRSFSVQLPVEIKCSSLRALIFLGGHLLRQWLCLTAGLEELHCRDLFSNITLTLLLSILMKNANEKDHIYEGLVRWWAKYSVWYTTISPWFKLEFKEPVPEALCHQHCKHSEQSYGIYCCIYCYNCCWDSVHSITPWAS